jgi:hypothetical protein
MNSRELSNGSKDKLIDVGVLYRFATIIRNPETID